MPTKYLLSLLLLSLTLSTACSSVSLQTAPVGQLRNSSLRPTPASSLAPVRDVQIQVTDASMNPLAGATVEISSSLFMARTTTTNSLGHASFSQLRVENQLNIRVTAPGYQPRVQTLDPNSLATQSSNSLQISTVLQIETGQISGQIIDSQGKGLSQVVISDGQQSVLSDASGNFRLSYTANTEVKLSFNRQGYQPASQERVTPTTGARLNTVTLQPLQRNIRIVFDLSKSPLGKNASEVQTLLQDLKAQLQQLNYQVDLTVNSLISLNNVDILVLPSPARAYSTDEQNLIQSFVSNGGKLIVSGEWSGFKGFSPEAVNQLLGPMGLAFSVDTLRENSNSYLTLNTFEPHAITQGLKQIKFYQSGSVELDSTASGVILARTTAQAFRIANNQGAFGVAAAALYGSGKVVLLGDSSWWLNEDSDLNHTPNLQEADNAKFAEQMMGW